MALASQERMFCARAEPSSLAQACGRPSRCSAFIISPLTIGLVAKSTSLRSALELLIPTSLAIVGLATRWPATPAISRPRACVG